MNFGSFSTANSTYEPSPQLPYSGVRRGTTPPLPRDQDLLLFPPAVACHGDNRPRPGTNPTEERPGRDSNTDSADPAMAAFNSNDYMDSFPVRPLVRP